MSRTDDCDDSAVVESFWGKLKTEMVDLAARSLGYTIDDFCAFRYRLSCPPIPAASVLRHPLLKPKPG